MIFVLSIYLILANLSYSGLRASLTPFHNLLQNGVRNGGMNKQKKNYSLFCFFITPFSTPFCSKLWNEVGDALKHQE